MAAAETPSELEPSATCRKNREVVVAFAEDLAIGLALH